MTKENFNPSDLMRLSKLMSQRGLCSRREADDLIVRGYVIVDGKVADQLGIRVAPDCNIELLHQAKKQMSENVTILLNKPIGYVSGQPEDNYEPAVRLITSENQEKSNSDQGLDKKHFDGLAPAGRLDIDSQGLLIFTQSGVIAKKLIGENSEIEKEYLVRVHGFLSDANLVKLNFGLELDGKKLKRATQRRRFDGGRVLHAADQSHEFCLCVDRSVRSRRGEHVNPSGAHTADASHFDPNAGFFLPRDQRAIVLDGRQDAQWIFRRWLLGCGVWRSALRFDLVAVVDDYSFWQKVQSTVIFRHARRCVARLPGASAFAHRCAAADRGGASVRS